MSRRIPNPLHGWALLVSAVRESRGNELTPVVLRQMFGKWPAVTIGLLIVSLLAFEWAMRSVYFSATRNLGASWIFYFFLNVPFALFAPKWILGLVCGVMLGRFLSSDFYQSHVRQTPVRPISLYRTMLYLLLLLGGSLFVADLIVEAALVLLAEVRFGNSSLLYHLFPSARPDRFGDRLPVGLIVFAEFVHHCAAFLHFYLPFHFAATVTASGGNLFRSVGRWLLLLVVYTLVLEAVQTAYFLTVMRTGLFSPYNPTFPLLEALQHLIILAMLFLVLGMLVDYASRRFADE